MEREWILHVLEQGISDRHCYELCDQQGIFKILLGFGSSPLCDERSQVHSERRRCITSAASQMKDALKPEKWIKVWNEHINEEPCSLKHVSLKDRNHLLPIYRSLGADHEGVVPGGSCHQSSL